MVLLPDLGFPSPWGSPDVSMAKSSSSTGSPLSFLIWQTAPGALKRQRLEEPPAGLGNAALMVAVHPPRNDRSGGATEGRRLGADGGDARRHREGALSDHDRGGA